MTNSQSKHLSEYPRRTQEIAMILCELLGEEIELPRKIIGHLKEAETERDREYHMSLLRTRCWITSIKSVNECVRGRHRVWLDGDSRSVVMMVCRRWRGRGVYGWCPNFSR